MQLLVACSQCKRQYDAGDLEVGSRFHCHCGQVVQVRQPDDHEASVVRCSSCGAPREAAAVSCTFCGADFTLHERDLDSVCPECLARISRRAKHCHHCGVRIQAELAASEVSPLACPDCGEDQPPRLVSRPAAEGTYRLLECPRCAGLWLDTAAFGALTDRAADQSVGEQEFGRLTGELASSSPGGSGSEAGSGKWRYRNCPVCGDMMQRRNYGRMSGIIIDTCRQHGVWLDLDELPRILQWIRTGGLAHAQQQVAQQQKTEDITRRLARPTPGGRVTLNDSWEESDRPSSDLDLVFTALQAFFR